jgi:hypothetical protein
MNQNPKSPLEEIFEHNDPTRLGSGKLSEFDTL